MKLLRKTIHPSIDSIDSKSFWERPATRGIIVKNNEILLLYTERYDDFSLPGGGVDDGEDIIEGLKRELSEETGAQNIREVIPFGKYEEYRQCTRTEFDLVFITSYCYLCKIDDELGATKYESYEKKNGMTPRWIDINKAIDHNQKTLSNSPKSGFSIERELYLLNLIRDHFKLF